MRLRRQQAQELIEHARQTAPNEVCGLLAGQHDGVQLIIPITNIAPDPAHNFEMEHRAFVKAMFQIQRQDMTLIGIYHSHPTGEPIPSPADVAQAQYPDVNYVIIGLRVSVPQIAAWSIRNYTVTNVDIDLDATSAKSQQLELSASGHKAIILSAVIAVIVALFISLLLLPPAPVIP